jgi:Lrp/AsnC family leucine-responsive transcriptional regulator
MIDDIDLRILSIIQENARQSDAEIARQEGVTPSVVFERIRKLERRRVIRGYEARLSPPALGLEVVAFVFVRTRHQVDGMKTARLLAQIPEVQEVHRIAGEDCYLVKVRVANAEALGRLLREKLDAIESVCSTRSTMVLKIIKETTQLPLNGLITQGAGD